MKHFYFLVNIICLTMLSLLSAQTASKVYYTRLSVSSFFSANLDGNAEVTIALSGSPKSIAVDWNSNPKKLYIGLVPSGEDPKPKIIRCDLDGGNPEDVLTALVNVNDIELDLHNRKIFWIQNTYSDDRIFKADMDALNSNVTQIYSSTTAAEDLWGLALDVPNQRLYITQRGSTNNTSYIRRMTYSGASITTIKNPVDNPKDIEFYNDKIYWGDRVGIKSANPDGSGETTILADASMDGLAIDGTNNRIYYTDYSAGRVKRIDISGENPLSFPTHHGVTIARIATDYNPSALPVELISFSAKAINNKVVLTWKTASEINNYGFDIERKVLVTNSDEENDTWIKVGFVAGNGNSNSMIEYVYSDIFYKEGKTLYRLKQIDTDGSFNYSSEVAVVINLVTDFSIEQNYPNPFNPSTVIKYTVPEDGYVNLRLYDMLGREVGILVNEYKRGGSYQFELRADKYNLRSGVYFYELRAGTYRGVRKLVLMK